MQLPKWRKRQELKHNIHRTHSMQLLSKQYEQCSTVCTVKEVAAGSGREGGCNCNCNCRNGGKGKSCEIVRTVQPAERVLSTAEGVSKDCKGRAKLDDAGSKASMVSSMHSMHS